MEASTTKNKSFTHPRPISELLPSLSGILSEDAIHTLTAKKQPRSTMALTQTAEKVVRPLTLAEMNADILALKPHSPRRFGQAPPSNKKGWNSSVKVEKKIKHTSNDQMKNNPVRKVLNFQPKPKPVPNPRMTMANSETPKFPKPAFRAKKSLHLQAKSTVRISGVCNIPPTPIETTKTVKRVTISNKENHSLYANITRKVLPPPTPMNQKPPAACKMVVDTPLSNTSWKSGSDASFLQREKEIQDIEEKVQAIVEEQTLENIAEVSPPVSTPFKEYRSVQEYFNNSSVIENSAMYNDNTIMCFDKHSICNENDKREESVIVSLCNLFNKAAVIIPEKTSTELDNLLEVEKQTEQNIKMLENGIQMLTNIKDAQQKSLQNVRNMIEEKRKLPKMESDKDKTLTAEPKTPKIIIALDREKSPIVSRPCSVIKSCINSPTYKIPKKNLGLRKKVFCKSMPNVSSGLQTPVKDIDGRALNMYMKMKEQMNFLSTPMVNRNLVIPDTPAVTSRNLQKQLDKLFGS